MADADREMRIEEIVNNNKNERKDHKFGYINCVTKTFLKKKHVYNVVRTTTTKELNVLKLKEN